MAWSNPRTATSTAVERLTMILDTVFGSADRNNLPSDLELRVPKGIARGGAARLAKIAKAGSDLKGAARIRTGDEGFADLCLTTWLRRQETVCDWRSTLASILFLRNGTKIDSNLAALHGQGLLERRAPAVLVQREWDKRLGSLR